MGHILPKHLIRSIQETWSRAPRRVFAHNRTGCNELPIVSWDERRFVAPRRRGLNSEDSYTSGSGPMAPRVRRPGGSLPPQPAQRSVLDVGHDGSAQDPRLGVAGTGSANAHWRRGDGDHRRGNLRKRRFKDSLLQIDRGLGGSPAHGVRVLTRWTTMHTPSSGTASCRLSRCRSIGNRVWNRAHTPPCQGSSRRRWGDRSRPAR